MLATKLEQSLCGYGVAKSSKIIGWLLLVYHLIGVSYLIYGYYLTLYLMNKEEPGSTRENNLESQLTIILVIGAVLIVYAILDVILLIGVYKGWPAFMLMWIFVGVISTILGFFSNIPYLVVVPLFGGIPGTIISVGVSIYCLLIVNCHYQNLKAIIKKSSPTCVA